MLHALRSFVGSWVAKILLVLLVGSFALWGVSGSILGGTDTSSVAQVGETKVSVRDYLRTYTSNMNLIQQQAGRRLTRDEGRIFGAEARTLNSVISVGALDEFARINGLSLSDETLSRLIAENEDFQDSTGKFNRETFRRLVNQSRMRESEYIEAENTASVRSQVIKSIGTGSILPDVFKNALSTYVQETRKFDYVIVTPELAGKPAEPTNAQLQTYFDANLKKYAAPEYRKLTILSLEPKDLADEAAIADEAVKDAYEARKKSYITPEQRRVQQIVFKSQEDADKAVKDLSEGALFETVLSDNKIELKDADLGMLAKDKVPQVLQDAVFSAEMNTPSGIIKGPFGPTMVRVTEIAPQKTTPLEDVKDDLRKNLALRQAAEEIVAMQESVEDIRAGGLSLTETAKQLKLKTRTIDAIDRSARTPDDTVITDIPESINLLAQAFKTDVGTQSSPLTIGSSGYLWFDVEGITPARDRKLGEVTDRVKADWLVAEQQKLVDAKAEEIAERARKGEDLNAIALDLGIERKTTGLLKRAGQQADFPNAATGQGYSGAKGHVAVTGAKEPGQKLVLKVAEVQLPEAQVVEAPEAELALANQGAGNDLLDQMISNLRNKYAITQNPTLINQALTQSY